MRTVLILAASSMMLAAGCAGADAGGDVESTTEALGGNRTYACGQVFSTRSLTADNTQSHMRYELCGPYNDVNHIQWGMVGGSLQQDDNYSGIRDVYGAAVGAMYQFAAQTCWTPALNPSICSRWLPTEYIYNPYPFTDWLDLDQTYGRDPSSGLLVGFESLPGNGGRALHSCIAMYNNGTHVGKWFADQPTTCHIGYGGAEVNVQNGMVFMGGTLGTYWVDSGYGYGSKPIAAGRENGSTVQYLCRGQFRNPSTGKIDWTPGKTVGSRCNVGWGGREWAVTPFQTLNSN